MPIPAHGSAAHPAEHSRHLAFDASLEALPVLAEMLETLAEELGWDAATTMQINLVAEELIVNIVSYGYPDGRPGHIDVWLDASPSAIQLCIEDDGDAFDPFAADAPDLTLAVEERPIGGLGVHFMRTYTDLQAYQRIAGRNRVTLVKHIAL